MVLPPRKNPLDQLYILVAVGIISRKVLYIQRTKLYVFIYKSIDQNTFYLKMVKQLEQTQFIHCTRKLRVSVTTLSL